MTRLSRFVTILPLLLTPTVASTLAATIASSPAASQERGRGGPGGGEEAPGPGGLSVGGSIMFHPPRAGDAPAPEDRQKPPPPDFLSTRPRDYVPKQDDQLSIPLPYAPSRSGTREAQPVLPETILEARLVQGGKPVPQGLVWRVFGSQRDKDGELPLVTTAHGGTTSVQLAPGTYFVNAALGRASATKKITVGREAHSESIVLDAGGLRLNAVVGDDKVLAKDKVDFEISQNDDSGQHVVVLPHATAGQILGLAAGTYHVVCHYGNLNAVVRADIEVKAGKLTEATMRQVGADVTLKLVAADGGEALANTSWTVLTPDGDTLSENVGAFPHIVLAEGTYTVVARHKDQVYTRNFDVKAGGDHDVEVHLSDVAPAQGEGLPVGVPHPLAPSADTPMPGAQAAAPNGENPVSPGAESDGDSPDEADTGISTE
ncbi:hypothetical protein SAMN05216548_102397 [Faunimonas pinastri]|uniref:Uncharacterized protein n=1 Tax=Faunimonas pinastri TaxID=1855383 RepID=A0A1H9D9S1_9HYPH|nr:hypothetical protein [Faunimonas pinastri]SEQ10242.1 hypothetical protein SAMN05216548_102397 [Faunimonas pinastri]